MPRRVPFKPRARSRFLLTCHLIAQPKLTSGAFSRFLHKQSPRLWATPGRCVPLARKAQSSALRCLAPGVKEARLLSKTTPPPSAEAIVPRSEDFSRWYLDLIAKAELADYGPVRGTMVIRPYGYALWEALQNCLDRRFKETGHENVYFPQLIPYSFIEKEKNHVEGFAPELALVTKGGGKDLEEPLVVRPTSETIVNFMFSQWIQSYRDLPLLLNQWANVHRWEMRTRPFIRTSEFLWQEGHTAHATAEEAEKEALQMIHIYEEVARELAAMPVIAGRKSKIESFAGAEVTYTIEAMMGDRRALQAGTSHDLSTNFAEAFGIQYETEKQEQRYVHQTSWGMSTRMIGGVIMTHGDDQGLRLPPRMAPKQVVIIPIVPKVSLREEILAAAEKVRSVLSEGGVRVILDDNESKSPGWRYNFWEMKGVPVRIEIGPRDLEKQSCVTCRRDRPGRDGKQFGIPIQNRAELLAHVQSLLEEIQQNLLHEATLFRDANLVNVSSYSQFKEAIGKGQWAIGPWAGSDEDERRVKEETQATLRCFPFEQPEEVGPCFYTGKEAKEIAVFAKAY